MLLISLKNNYWFRSGTKKNTENELDIFSPYCPASWHPSIISHNKPLLMSDCTLKEYLNDNAYLINSWKAGRICPYIEYVNCVNFPPSSTYCFRVKILENVVFPSIHRRTDPFCYPSKFCENVFCWAHIVFTWVFTFLICRLETLDHSTLTDEELFANFAPF